MKRMTLAAVAAALAIAAAAGWLAWSAQQSREREIIAQDLAKLTFPAYAPQKVVYHVTMSGGWFDRSYRDLLHSLGNHVAAVGAGRADLRVVLQGDGLGLLADAETNADLRSSVDKLRAAGVRFMVCRNSMAGRGLRPVKLYGVGAQDIVPAAVAEISALEGQGFVYLKF